MILAALLAGWGLCCKLACLLWWAAGQVAVVSKVVAAVAFVGRLVGSVAVAAMGEAGKVKEGAK